MWTPTELPASKGPAHDDPTKTLTVPEQTRTYQRRSQFHTPSPDSVRALWDYYTRGLVSAAL